MRARATTILLLCGLLLAGCGGKSHPTTGPTTTAAQQHALELYFLSGNALTATQVSVPDTSAIATAALQRLFAGPPPGVRTAIPAGTRLESIAVSGGRATVRLSTDRLTHSAEGQIVYTLTQFSTITSVDGGPFAAPASRADFADLTPRAAIYVSAPERDSSASSPIHASGTADVFEGSLAVDVWSNGKRIRTQPIQATSGTGTRGTWSATIAVPPGPAKLVFYEPSAENGQPLHATTVEVTVR
jgi:sporulation and spore germination protein/immunoglobulin-like protein involved in spore germination